MGKTFEEIAAIRCQINAGTYETAERIDAAIESVLDDLDLSHEDPERWDGLS